MKAWTGITDLTSLDPEVSRSVDDLKVQNQPTFNFQSTSANLTTRTALRRAHSSAKAADITN